MSEIITGLTRGGAAWTPAFVVELNQKTCIGCGRCRSLPWEESCPAL